MIKYHDHFTLFLLVSFFQDEHPPIPDSLSRDITDFLCQCFKKVKWIII